MLIIGHRGAAGEKPDNSLAGIQAAIDAGADMVELDVRLTRDNKVVLAHDFHLYKSHGHFDIIRRLTLTELHKRTAGSQDPIVTLEQAIKLCENKIFMMIEIKDRHAGKASLSVITKHNKAMLNHVMFSSFSVRELIRLRNLNKKVKLALLMRLNPFAFLAWERKLKLSAVGFHRLHINPLAIQAAHQLDMFVYVYNVNRKASLKQLMQRDVDGVVTDYPTLFMGTGKKHKLAKK